MNPLAAILLILLSFSVIDVVTQRTNRKSGRRRLPETISTNKGLNRNPTSSTEQESILSECEIPDRPKPEPQIKLESQLCGCAVSLPKPQYPEEAKRQNLSGLVRVEVVTDEKGSVIWAKAISGPDVLRRSSLRAACQARYCKTVIAGRAIKVEHTIQYNFVSQ